MHSKKIKDKIINNIMKNGKKKTSENILLKTGKKIQKTNKKNHLSILKLAITNTAPIIKLKEIKRKKRKTKKYLPYVLNEKNRISNSLKKIIEAKKVNKKSLANEIIVLANDNSDNVFENKKNAHESAIAKKKYLYFRWFS